VTALIKVLLLRQCQAENEAMTDEEIAANVDVLRSIDEDRLSDRKLFADILEDEVCVERRASTAGVWP
jgi:hypothetical protein